MLTAVEVLPLLEIAAQLDLGLVEPTGQGQHGAEIEPVSQMILVRLPVTVRRTRACAAVTLRRSIELLGTEQEIADVALDGGPLPAPATMPALDGLQFPQHDLFSIDQPTLIQKAVSDVE
ncbi:hypothetical protein GCM10023194_43520 [Planotetraspora phitsanulokensis]|uniref:Uncharacterized protein n=1 Tax=Planotetraspora phitsanulokensis TaxID=575192 RepID=A0A8J3XEN1_9ACTN|nr:hypothetical protein Pph01_29570 [Planotetraspora phitsanulokensis]